MVSRKSESEHPERKNPRASVSFRISGLCDIGESEHVDPYRHLGHRTALQAVEIFTVLITFYVDVALAAYARLENDHFDSPRCLRGLFRRDKHVVSLVIARDISSNGAGYGREPGTNCSIRNSFVLAFLRLNYWLLRVC
jgi:hypothetical protein